MTDDMQRSAAGAVAVARRVDDLTYRSDSTEQTIGLGRVLGALLREGDVLVLTGDLGAGKTQFAKGVSRGLGDTGEVTSPTFAIMAVHEEGRIPLFHFDLYRLEHAYELEDTGIFDVLGYEGVCLLEWGEQFEGELADDFLTVRIDRDPADEGARTISLEAHGDRAAHLASSIDAKLTKGAA